MQNREGCLERQESSAKPPAKPIPKGFWKNFQAGRRSIPAKLQARRIGTIEVQGTEVATIVARPSRSSVPLASRSFPK